MNLRTHILVSQNPEQLLTGSQVLLIAGFHDSVEIAISSRQNAEYLLTVCQ
jgi:hypothetical protein